MPLYPPSVCQISRKLDKAFAFFVSVQKEEEKQQVKNEETKPIFEVAYLWNA